MAHGSCGAWMGDAGGTKYAEQITFGADEPTTTKKKSKNYNNLKKKKISYTRYLVPGTFVVKNDKIRGRLVGSLGLYFERAVCCTSTIGINSNINPFRTPVPFWGQTTYI